MAIERTLEDYIKKGIESNSIRAYHFSYDITGWEDEFESYEEARYYLWCVLKATSPIRIRPVNESSFILYIS